MRGRSLTTKDIKAIRDAILTENAPVKVIAERLGVSASSVYKVCSKDPELAIRMNERKLIYPRLELWRIQNGLSLREMVDRLGIARGTLVRILYKDGGATKYTIDKILALTGLTYEEAFRRDPECVADERSST